MAIETVADLERAYPHLVATIRQEARDGERKRLKGIHDLASPGLKALANKLMFLEPVSTEQAALAFLQAERGQRVY